MAGFRTEYEQKKWDSLEAEQNFPFKKMLAGIATPEDLKRAQSLLAKYNKLAGEVFNMGLQAMQKAASNKVEKISARASRSGKPLGRVALENLYTKILQREQQKQLPEIAKAVKDIIDEQDNKFKSFMETLLPPSQEKRQEETSAKRTIASIPALLDKNFKDAANPIEKANESIVKSTKDLIDRSKDLVKVLGSDLGLSEVKDELSALDPTRIDSVELTARDSDRVADMLERMQLRQGSFYSKLEDALVQKQRRDDSQKADQEFRQWLKDEEARKKKEEKERKENSFFNKLRRTRDRFDKAKQSAGPIGRFMKGLSLMMMRGLIGIGSFLLAKEFFPKLDEVFKPENIAKVGGSLIDMSVAGITKLKDEILPNFAGWVSETFTKLWPKIKEGASEVYNVLKTNKDGSPNLLGRLDNIASMNAPVEKKAQYAIAEVGALFGIGSGARSTYDIDLDRDAAYSKLSRFKEVQNQLRSGKRNQIDPAVLKELGYEKGQLPNLRGVANRILNLERQIEGLEREREASAQILQTSASRDGSISLVNTANEAFNITNNPSLSGFSPSSNTRVQEDPTPTITTLPETPVEGSPKADSGFTLPRGVATTIENGVTSVKDVPSVVSPSLAIYNASVLFS